jgi:glutathione S-transferase
MFTVWGRRNSSNVQKVLWALEEAGVDYEQHSVGGSFGGTDTREFRKMNPNGLVPVVKDGTLTIYESHAIVRYIAKRYGRGTIMPRGNRAFALAEQWMEWSISTFNPPLNGIFWNKIRVPADQCNADDVKASEKRIAEVIKIVDRGLGRKPWLTGKHFSYGDIPLGILYWRYKCLDTTHARVRNLDRWFEQLQERPAYQKTVMLPIGGNVTEWQANEQKYG